MLSDHEHPEPQQAQAPATIIQTAQNVIVLPLGTMELAAGYYKALSEHTNAPNWALCVELARLTLTNTGRRFIEPMVQAQEQHDAEMQS